jgi:hypothetical protein
MKRILVPTLLAGAVSLGLAAAQIAGAAGRSEAAVTPPAQPGAWMQLGTAPRSSAGKKIHFYRTAQTPHALGIVVTSTSSGAIRLVWQSYCEFQSDDEQTLEDHGAITGVHSVTAYPSTFPAATLCYVWVIAGTSGTAKVTGAVFQS